MSDLISKKQQLNRNAVASAVALALGSGTAHADQLTATIDGWFTMLNSTGSSALTNDDYVSVNNGMYGRRTPVTGTVSFDTETGVGTGTVEGFSFFGSGLALATTITFQAIGDGNGGPGTLVLGNMGFNWNNNNGIPVSLVMDASGFFNALAAIDDTASTPLISGTGAFGATEFFEFDFGAIGTYTLPMGAAPMATTTFNTTNIGSPTLGTNPSGTLPLTDDDIGGSPMPAGPFTGFNANFDMTDIQVTGYTDTTPPVLTLNMHTNGDTNPVNINVGDGYVEQGATCTDAFDSADPVVNIGGDIVDPDNAGTYVVSYDCSDAAMNTAEATRTVNVTSAGTPVISLLGNNPATHEAATPYMDAGATCNDGSGGNIPLPTDNAPEFFDVTGNTVDVNTLGSYAVTYECTNSDGISATPVNRTVNVVDTTDPVITLDPDCPAEGITVVGGPGEPDPTPGASCSDSLEGPLAVNKTGDIVDPDPDFGSALFVGNTVNWSCADSSGNSSLKTCNITIGNPLPVATLRGNATQTLGSGAGFDDPGATCEDFLDGPLDDALADMVIDDTTADGEYTITYTCGPNSGGMTGTTTRLVIVGAAYASSDTDGSTFVMIGPTGSFIGGADDVFFSWSGALYDDPDTQTDPNMFMGSAQPQPFQGFPWLAHDIRAFGPGDYTITTSRGNSLSFHVNENQVGAHMLFDWNKNDDIDVALVWDINGVFVGSNGAADDLGSKGTAFSLASIDADGDGLSGIPMADGPFAGFNANFNIKLTPQFTLPVVSMSAAQDGNEPITVVGADDGDVTVSTSVDPSNNSIADYYGQEGFSYDWSDSSAELTGAGCDTGETCVFSPSGLSGPFTAQVKVTDNRTGLTSTTQLQLEVAALADPDSDGDGIPDSQDTIDNIANPSMQQTDDGTASSSAGKFILGDDAVRVGVTSGDYDIEITDADLDADPIFDTTCVGGCFSFRITGLTPGSNVDVTLPLSEPFPADGAVRKYVNGTWRPFDTSSGPAIRGGDAILSGPGDTELVLRISDGGPNDADGLADGIVTDPVGVASGAQEVVIPGDVKNPSKGGCSIAGSGVAAGKRAEWWLLSGFLAWLGWQSRRRTDR